MPIGTSKVGALGGLVPGGTETFNAPGTFSVPPGVKKVSVTGAGGTGNPGNPGNTGNPGNPGNAGNAGNPGSGGSGGGGHTPCPGAGSLSINYNGGPTLNISPFRNAGGLSGNANPSVGTNLTQRNFNAASAGNTGQNGSAGNAGSAGNVGQAGTGGNAGNTGQTSSVFGQNYTGGAGGNAGNAGTAGVAGTAGAAGQAGNGGPGGGASPLASPVGTPGGSNGSGATNAAGGGTGGAGANALPFPVCFPNKLASGGGGGGGGAGTSGSGGTGQNGIRTCGGPPFPGTHRRTPGGVGGTTFNFNTPGPLPATLGAGYGGWAIAAQNATFYNPAPFWPTFVTGCISNSNCAVGQVKVRIPLVGSNSFNINIPCAVFNQPNTRPLVYRGGGGGAGGAQQGIYGTNLPDPTNVSYGNGGASGGGRANAANAGGAGGSGGPAPAGGAGNPGQTATPATNNCVPVTPGSTYPVTVGTGGTITISWNPQ